MIDWSIDEKSASQTLHLRKRGVNNNVSPLYYSQFPQNFPGYETKFQCLLESSSET
jgi:hypothetical protein